jgi:Fuc2NAc and GlcNAc transferase
LIVVNLVSLIIVINSDSVLTLLSASFAAATGGFLLWNWAPAKIFMGDVGSSFIGFTLGVMALLSLHHGSMTVWTWVLLLGVFIVDTTLTLFVRYRGKQRWHEGHASHAYQNAARHYKSHAKVTITVVLIPQNGAGHRGNRPDTFVVASEALWCGAREFLILDQNTQRPTR